MSHPVQKSLPVFDTSHLGLEIRSLRKKYRLSQDQLAKKAGITKSHLSLIENDKRSVTVKTLRQILEAMNESLASFFSDPHEEQDIIYRADGYIPIPEANDSYTNKLLAPVDGERKLEAILTVIQSGGSLGEPYNHRGEEFGFVLQGEGILHVDGKEYRIMKGDRFYFKSDLLHTVVNTSSSDELHVLFVSTPPTF